MDSIPEAIGWISVNGQRFEAAKARLSISTRKRDGWKYLFLFVAASQDDEPGISIDCLSLTPKTTIADLNGGRIRAGDCPYSGGELNEQDDDWFEASTVGTEEGPDWMLTEYLKIDFEQSGAANQFRVRLECRLFSLDDMESVVPCQAEFVVEAVEETD